MSPWNLGQNDPPEELITMKNQLASKESQIAAFQTQLMKKSEEFDELKKSFEDAIHKAKSKRALDLEANLRQRDSELTNEKLTRQNLETALTTATKEYKESDLEIRNLQSILDSISHDSRSQQERYRQLQKERDTLQERVKELQTQMPQPSTEPAKRTHRRSSSLSSFRVTTLEQELRETKAALQKRDEELHIVKGKLSVATSDANRFENEKLALERSLSKKIRELEATLEEKEEEIQCLRDEGGNGDRERELMDRIDEDEAKIAALESMLRNSSALEDKLHSTEQQLLEERRKVQQITQLHAQLKSEKEKLVEDLRVAHGEIENTRPMHVSGSSDDSTTHLPLSDDMDTSELVRPSEVDPVAYIGKLLAAVDRLRDERDNLQRNVHFLESESRFTIEALEAKLSASIATTVSTGETVGTLAQMKAEMDALHQELSVTKDHAESDIRTKTQEIDRLHRIILALGVTLGRLPAADGQNHADLVAGYEARIKEVEEKLDVTVLCLEATTSQRDDLVNTLRDKEASWAEEVDIIRHGHQQASRTIEDLGKQVDELTGQLEEVESQRNSLAVQIKNLESDLEAARSDLTKAESRYSELQFHQLNSMTSSEATATLRTQIHELEARVMRRNEQLGIHQHDIRRLETNLRLQEDRLMEMTAEMEMLNAQKDAMVEDCANTREERDVALHRVEELEEEMANLEASHAKDEATICALVSVIIETAGKARQALREQRESGKETANASLRRALEVVEELTTEKVRLEENVEANKQRIDELLNEVDNLRAAHEADISLYSTARTKLEQQLEQLHTEIKDLRLAKEELQRAHDTEVERLASESARLQSLLQEAEVAASAQKEGHESAQRSKDEDTSELQARVLELTRRLAENDARFSAEREQLEARLRDAVDAKDAVDTALKGVQGQLTSLEEQHASEVSQLRASLQTETDALLQSSAAKETLERENKELRAELDAASSKMAEVEASGGEKLKELENKLEAQGREAEELSRRAKDLSQQVREAEELRAREQEEHRLAITSSAEMIQRHETSVKTLEDDLARLKDELQTLDRLYSTAQQEKTQLQEQTTDLLAKVEQGRSVQRVLQDQVEEREQAMKTLEEELVSVREELARVEQANAKANLNMSLTSAQHKREMTDLQRELQNLRSKSNLEQVIAELQERNQEMDDLLRQKCAEIEANDDKSLEMLRENKKLTAKVENLTRKVTSLQNKLASLKEQRRQGDVRPSAPSAPVQVESQPEPTFQRPPSLATSISQPTFTAPPVASSSKPVPRATSFSSRPKTPEKSLPPAPMPVFRNRTPEQLPYIAPDPSSVVGKKRRAPDDFEVCESVPPQVFTAESLPGEKTENRTPRVRRVLSSLQTGFTPNRSSARPVASMPSPDKQANVPAAFISDVTNSPLVIPPLHSGLQSAKSKRSWLGKIRGASSSTSGHGHGMSRHQ
ncbi:hypothetical protein CC1G_06552 [Coprinopsis cinerea okayama7|uniref:Uncharacterized protein n=1 Tax=Coprinopsis cinerea (strain Okayama-7 / 130 / ATCC MYA-4618 / FGSC 9003) TaxID=240176 RepID=A8N343_COPC7|nr:hypothetical protein CC1G_06552 [Coprinopsis cinerea okayama7\|eukprot:XP_001829215.2 hypothetical protein CC1G_06552 [Coprinopsis cinerea okayama7\